jgi:WD40 repeat protein
VAFSPDGKRLVSGSQDMTLKVWKGLTGQQLLTLQGHTSAVSSVAFSPDGKRIVSGSFDRTVKVWNAQTGQVERTLQGHLQPVRSVAFSPDGKRIVSGSHDNTVKVWNVQTGQVEDTLRGHTGWVHCVTFSPDGKRIVSSSQDNTLKVWNLSEANAVRPEPGEIPSPELAYLGKQEGAGFTTHRLTISNRAAFPDELFQPSPDLPPIGLNKSASRTLIEIYDVNDRYIYGFVAFTSSADLNRLSFAIQKDKTPPKQVYVVLNDRKLKRRYKSNLVTIAEPKP